MPDRKLTVARKGMAPLLDTYLAIGEGVKVVEVEDGLHVEITTDLPRRAPRIMGPGEKKKGKK